MIFLSGRRFIRVLLRRTKNAETKFLLPLSGKPTSDSGYSYNDDFSENQPIEVPDLSKGTVFLDCYMIQTTNRKFRNMNE